MRKIIIILSFILITGCSTIKTSIPNGNGEFDGIKVNMPPVNAILVEKDHIRFVQLPGKPYAIKPISILSKTKIDITLDSFGEIKQINNDFDTTAFIQILGKITDKATGGINPNNADASEKIEGTFGFKPGIYIWDNQKYIFKKLTINN